uniref:ATPase ASNA1 homolog n=1 Tax=Arcella intermedia TaxID=1963864 RepID=A0A6B2L9X8_9EUKA
MIAAKLEPTLQSLLDKKSLKWIFVGGKGGVGKTTCSSCISIMLSKKRERVLIISTDPAHNLSDAFAQKFTRSPTLVNGFDNLYAMEIDPSREAEDKEIFNSAADNEFFKEIAFAIPGIDEAMSFAEMMKLVQSMSFDTIVFDTAPTGHTLRLLSFPTVLDKALGKIMKLKSQFSGLFSQIQTMISGATQTNPEDMQDKMEQTKKIITEVNDQFRNPDLTTFICVCIPEFLSLYETERLVQELTKFKIDVDNIIINQVLFPDKGNDCGFCHSRVNMQKKYVNQINDLYEDFHVVKLPLLKQEIRGQESLEAFSKYMLIDFEKQWKEDTQ